MPKYHHEQDIIDVLKDLKTRIEKLEKGNPLQNASIDVGGTDASVYDQNIGIRVRDADTNRDIFIIGADVNAPKPNGNTQPFVAMYRADDGSLAFSLYDTDPSDGSWHQVISFTDRKGNRIVADDTNSGFGLAIPYLHYPLFPSFASNMWYSTTSTAYSTAYESYIAISQPMLYIRMGLISAGQAGVAQVVVDGVSRGSNVSFSTSVFGEWLLPMYQYVDVVGQMVDLQIQIRCVGGNNQISCYPISCFGRGI